MSTSRFYIIATSPNGEGAGVYQIGTIGFAVGVGVKVDVLCGVGVNVDVAVFVAVGVEVFVAVGVEVFVAVGVKVGVLVGVDVNVGGKVGVVDGPKSVRHMPLSVSASQKKLLTIAFAAAVIKKAQSANSFTLPKQRILPGGSNFSEPSVRPSPTGWL